MLTNSTDGTCLPKNTPGLAFWKGQEATTISSQANKQCVVTFEKGLFGGEKCIENCECLEDNWENKQKEACSAVGDCGPIVNLLDKKGSGEGFEVIRS